MLVLTFSFLARWCCHGANGFLTVINGWPSQRWRAPVGGRLISMKRGRGSSGDVSFDAESLMRMMTRRCQLLHSARTSF